MTTFIITEKQNASSMRDGIKIEADNLSMAKKVASKNQVFAGTVLTIENESGEVLTIKEGSKWVDNAPARLYK